MTLHKLKKIFTTANLGKTLIIGSIIGWGQITIVRSSVSVRAAEKQKTKDCSFVADAKTVNPVMIAKLSQVLSNLDKTVNTSEGFDYWPNSGIRIAYYHLATFLSYKTISQLSPYPVFLSGPHGAINLNLNSSQTFGHYNPKFLQWFQDHLIEILQDKSFVRLTKQKFHTYLGNTAKTYWATYTVLNQYPNELNTLLEDYQKRLKDRSIPEGYYYNIAWRENSKQYDSLSQLSASYNVNVVAPAVYFWLRRRIDGTDEQIFSLLEYVLDTYQLKQATGLYHNPEELPIPNK